MKRQRPIYIAQTQPGFEVIAAEALVEFDDVRISDTFTAGARSGLVRFSYDGDPRDLLDMRLLEDLFVQVADFRGLPSVYAGLRELRDAVQRVPFDAAITLARTIKPTRGGQGKLRFRVVARQEGQASYRRVDAQDAVERGIAARSDHRWQRAEENALEFWLTLLPDRATPSQTEALLALRLSDEQMRHRAEKREHLPASLRPASAAALVWLTRPEPDDVFLDPMCGAGTLLIERALAGRYRLLLGGDIREDAIDTTLKNIGPRYKPIEIRQWDARQLPLDSASVRACAVNLPFGQQIGTPEETRVLYPAVLREFTRVLHPTGRLVVLAGDVPTFERALQRREQLERHASYPVTILGRRARIYVAERR